MLALVVLAAVLGWRELKRLEREHPQQLPWTELKLSHPIGRFTGIKLAALTSRRERCIRLLRDAGLAAMPFDQIAPDERRCRFTDGVRIRPENDRSVSYSPAGLVTSCPVAAGLALWEREVVQAAARRNLGSRVVAIDHAGSFSCRRLYGKADGPFSEHATADAIDILGFQLDDGRRVNVLRDWQGDAAEAAFLREVRDGGCRLFSTVLSPDYNAAHADHLHFDQADRGAMGWRLCR